MGKKKKEIIRIIRKDSNKEDYTFVSNDNILDNIKNMHLQQQIMKKSMGINLMIELRKKFIQRKHSTKAERF